MSALWIAHVLVHDEESYGKYAALATDAIAKHGGVLTIAEVLLWLAFIVVSMVSGGLLGCILLPFQLLLSLGIIVVHIICIVKAIQGERFKLPVLTPLVEKFPSV